MTRADGAKPSLPVTSRLRRVARLARLGLTTFVSNVVHRVRKLFAPKRRREQMDEEHREQTAATVVDTVGEMKGLAMKVGQQASYMTTSVASGPVIEQLARLQQDAPPMPQSSATRVIEESLGAPPDVVFAEWDPEPVAAASIGQVHRAVTKDGDVVAVKVQYPGAETALHADIDTVGLLGNVAARRARRQRAGSGADDAAADAPMDMDPVSMSALLDQFRARLVQETDYEREAANQELIEAAFCSDPRISVPRVYRDLSTKVVLTTAFATGARFAEAQSWEQDERDLAGETIFRFHYECVFRVRHHNADPHPGNYIFNKGGNVTFLDFGALWDIPDEFVDGVPRLLDVFDRATVEMGEVPAGRADFAKAASQRRGTPPSPMAMLGWFYDQFVVPGERVLRPPMESLMATMSGGKVSFADQADEAFVRDMARHVGQSGNALFGVQAVLSSLGAKRDWRAIGRSIVDDARGAGKLDRVTDGA